MDLFKIIETIAIRALSVTTVFFLITTLIFLLTTILFARKYKKAKTSKETDSEKIDIHATTVQSFCFDAVMMQNQGKREYQQDSFYLSDKDDQALVTEKGVLAVVADGMGGLQDGKAISGITVDVFKSLFKESDVTDPHKFLTECIYRAETYVDEYMQSNSLKGGSTVVGAIVYRHYLYFVSVGDSNIFLIRKNKVTRLNRYHNYAAVLQSKVNQGKMTQQEADTNPMRSRITSFIGMGEVNEIDANAEPVLLHPDDVIILCSDGVSNALGDDAIVNLIHAGDFASLGERMEDSILRQNIRNQDNFSAVMIHCKDIIN